MAAQVAHTGVGSDKRLFAVPYHIPEPAVGQVGDIDQHPQPVHLLHHLDTKGFKPLSHHLRVGAVGVTQAVFIVPGQGDQSDSLVIEIVQPLHPAVEDAALLHRQKG